MWKYSPAVPQTVKQVTQQKELWHTDTNIGQTYINLQDKHIGISTTFKQYQVCLELSSENIRQVFRVLK